METRKFKPSDNLIFHIIKSQNSTHFSALRELIQNAYDAGATRCDVTITATGFEVRDDGGGFAGRQQIELFFETVGSAHSEAYTEQFGRFRMGRCQIMSFASTCWLSNQFEMLVDIRSRGLEYDLVEKEESCPGCAITGTWYEPLPERELLNLVSQIEGVFFFFYRIPIFLNGKRISVDFSVLRPTAETEDAYFLASPTAGFAYVYNLGIYASSVTGEHCNWSFVGQIITKQHLQLDVSRSVISTVCPVWKRIQAFLRLNYPLLIAGINLTPKRIQGILASIQRGHMTIKEVRALKLFTTPTRTSRYSLEDLAAKPYTFAIPDYKTLIADRIQQRGEILVLSLVDIALVVEHFSYAHCISSFQENLRLANLDEAATAVEHELIEATEKNYIPFDEVPVPVVEQEILDDRDLTPKERCALRAIRSAQSAAIRHLQAAGVAFTGPARRIYAGQSLSADGWTNGSSYIVLNQSLLGRLSHGPQQSEYVAAVLVHEWCHHAADPATHDAEFYRRYHDLTCHPKLGLLSYLAHQFISKYAQLLVKEGLSISRVVSTTATDRLRKRELKQLDRIIQSRIHKYNIQAGKQSIEFRLVQLYQAIKPIKHLIELPAGAQDLFKYLDKVSDRWPFILNELKMVFPLLPNPADYLVSGNSQRAHTLLQEHAADRRKKLQEATNKIKRGESIY